MEVLGESAFKCAFANVRATGSGPQRSGFLLIRRVAADKPTPRHSKFWFAEQHPGDKDRYKKLNFVLFTYLFKFVINYVDMFWLSAICLVLFIWGIFILLHKKQVELEQLIGRFKPLKNTIIWSLGNIAYGLACFLFIILSNIIYVRELVVMDNNFLLREGTLLFFCVSISGAVMVDFLIEEFRFSKVIEMSISLAPIIMTFFSCFVFFTLKQGESKNINIDFLLSYQRWVILITFGYCTGLKGLIFFRTFETEVQKELNKIS